MTTKEFLKPRIRFALWIAITIIIGLLVRKYRHFFPDFINLFIGDSIWAMMIYFIVGFLKPAAPIRKVALISLAFCYLIEISQLYHAPWIDAIRHTRLGGLVLGFGFLWSDIGAYTLGIGLVFVSFYILEKRTTARQKR